MKLDKKLQYVLVFSFSWAFAIFFRKQALYAGAGAVSFLLQSGVVSIILLGLYIGVIRKRELRRITKPILKQFVLLGFLIGGAWIVDALGLDATTSVNYSFLIKSGFIFSIVFAYIFFHERLHQKKLLLIGVFLLGVYFLTTGGQSIIPRQGDLFVILAALLYSSGTIVQKSLTKGVHPDIIGAIRTIGAWIVLVFVSPFFGWFSLSIIMPYHVLIVGILLCFTTIYLNKSLAVASVGYVTMLSTMVPILNAILGILFLNERMNTIQIIGGIIILASIGMVQSLKE